MSKNFHSIKTVLVSPTKSILLLRCNDASIKTEDGIPYGRFWSLPGGKREPGEGVEDCIAREIWEETGIKKEEITIGGHLWFGEFTSKIDGSIAHFKQDIFLVNTIIENISTRNMTNKEKRVFEKHCWFSLKDLLNSEEKILPNCLPHELEKLFMQGTPLTPYKINLDAY